MVPPCMLTLVSFGTSMTLHPCGRSTPDVRGLSRSATPTPPPNRRRPSSPVLNHVPQRPRPPAGPTSRRAGTLERTPCERRPLGGKTGGPFGFRPLHLSRRRPRKCLVLRRAEECVDAPVSSAHSSRAVREDVENGVPFGRRRQRSPSFRVKR